MSAAEDFQRFQGTPGYIASGPLDDAVNCALALERPLLVKGEPGTGKTLLAEAIAEALGAAAASLAREEHARAPGRPLRLRHRAAPLRLALRRRRRRATSAATSSSARSGAAFARRERVVLLIDEVDKADLEFPNDLLHELDRMRFRVSETGEEVVGEGAARS